MVIEDNLEAVWRSFGYASWNVIFFKTSMPG